MNPFISLISTEGHCVNINIDRILLFEPVEWSKCDNLGTYIVLANGVTRTVVEEFSEVWDKINRYQTWKSGEKAC